MTVQDVIKQFNRDVKVWTRTADYRDWVRLLNTYRMIPGIG